MQLETQDAQTLEKRIADWSQWQWLALMPVWLPGLLDLINRTPVPPERQGFALAFRLAMLALGIGAFIVVRLKIARLKKRLRLLEAASSPSSHQPPLADP